MEQLQHMVYTRLPNEDDGGFLKFPAVLVSEHVALAIFDEQLEVHVVKSTVDPGEYDLIYASNPMMYVGENVTSVFEDVRHSTLVELARKYPLLCTGSLIPLLKESHDERGMAFSDIIESRLVDVETLEQQGVTLEILQEIAEEVLREGT